ncbi:branched-chain amino acid ABC transporter permease [Azospirillum canadense]|uniref:branched-chain amino acid ABC transporter permease n=1 Tax=Azospirillum canadense TaxID=403962 RepID=UPI0022279426|nr:branched-chain amino acid ABC transporter permease [Azospirillum canadense]MCW2241100.1 branched-chain amino acid transport system permease protein [Azospirillum canadense]
MDVTVFAQQIANGLVNGMAYVLIATGLTLVFGVLRIVNFAHGEFYMLGAYITYFVGTLLGIDYLAAAAIAAVVVAALGIAANKLIFWPLRRDHEFTILLSSLGLALLISNGGELLFGADPKYVDSPFADEVLDIGAITLTQQRVLVFAAAVVALIGVYLFLRYSRFGKMMRATAQNPDGAALTGINIKLVHGYTFALACGLAALAGALVGPTVMIFPTIGNWAVLKGFIVVIMGGLGSVTGALFAGLLLGVIESLGGGYISLGFMEAIGYAMIIVVLLWRPNGLFSTARGLR